MAHVIMGPVEVEDSSLPFEPFLQGSPGKRGEDRKVGKLDVVFLDKENRVVGLAKTLRPNRISRFYSSASSVIELPAGTIDAADMATGDHIEVV